MLGLTKKAAALYRVGVVGVFVVLTAGAGVLGLRLARNQIASEIYRERLKALSDEYESLRARYNDAVRRTAVTELVVQDGHLSVNVRTAEGVAKTIETQFDPKREIYVDYVVAQGRLWIRRIFDAATPPGQGLVIEPLLADVDWDDARMQVGKAVYRSLDEGRWVVSVSGDGSLGLKRIEGNEPVTLAALPEVREYDEIEKEIAEAVDHIDFGDMLRGIVGGRPDR